MNKKLVQEIGDRMREKPSDELLAIWTGNDREQWSDEAFEAVAMLLKERDVSLPKQTQKQKPVLELYGWSGSARHTEDPKDVARLAALHLLCAERVNIKRTIQQTLPGTRTATLIHDSFTASRAYAIHEAKRAEGMLLGDSAGLPFLRSVTARAEALRESPVKGQVPREELRVPFMPAYTLGLQELAIMRANLVLADLDEFVSTIPGHEWLAAESE